MSACARVCMRVCPRVYASVHVRASSVLTACDWWVAVPAAPGFHHTQETGSQLHTLNTQEVHSGNRLSRRYAGLCYTHLWSGSPTVL